ncbi:MAG: hypothetical protein ACOYM0_08500 [Bacteroidales bacterium]
MKSQLSLISSSLLPGYSQGMQIDIAETWRKIQERVGILNRSPGIPGSGTGIFPLHAASRFGISVEI